MRTVSVAPRASILIESMRDIGYSLDTALADVIDNSITAGAQDVRILVDTTGTQPRLGILDDGSGMDEETLVEAMRPGSRSPLEKRDEADLGRFGLGLKTASFSQCRRLTVVSRKDGTTVCARWDLDLVSEKNDWLVEMPSDVSEVPWADLLGHSGTLVLWEKLDRLADPDGEEGKFLVRRIDDAIDHLELVFHRFLAGERGLKRIALSVNGRALEPFDPFHSSNLATIAGPIEIIRVKNKEVSVQTFTLPHHKKVTPAEWEKYAGRAGYVKNQGFYVYRGKRLIIHGTWFGLARQMELTKLARVRIDMPNGLDAEWKIDVKKASAHPPPRVRERLRRIIETIGATSKRVYTSRGRQLASDSRMPVWNRAQDKNVISYGINTEHPVLVEFAGRLSSELRADFSKVLELIGASMPVDALFADVSGQPEQISGNAMSDDAFEHAVRITFDQLGQAGLSDSSIIDLLKVTEPFRSAWEETERLLKAIGKEVAADV